MLCDGPLVLRKCFSRGLRRCEAEQKILDLFGVIQLCCEGRLLEALDHFAGNSRSVVRRKSKETFTLGLDWGSTVLVGRR